MSEDEGDLKTQVDRKVARIEKLRNLTPMAPGKEGEAQKSRMEEEERRLRRELVEIGRSNKGK